MEAITSIISDINTYVLWGIPLVLAIMGTGIFLTIRLRGLQVRKFKESVKTTIVPAVKDIRRPKTKRNGKTISQFEAFSAAISGTVGTGNIVGPALALLTGGPGAIFWMWISAFFGLITNYSENVLGLYFRKKNKSGEMSGGAMYYISEGLGWKWLGVLFAFFCMMAAVGMGMVQSNSISTTIQTTFGSDAETKKIIAYVVAVVVFILTALIVIGGIKRIGRVASLLVPFMALLFIICSLIIIAIHIDKIPTAFAMIFEGAFSFRAAGSGLFGYTIMLAMQNGFARGVFSNEAGLASSVIAHSASSTREPVKQGLWGIFEVFLDTFVICTLTAVTLIAVSLSTGSIDFTNIVANVGISKNDIAPMAFVASFGTVGQIIYTIILPLFAFTTILAWSYYGEKASEFFFGKFGQKGKKIFKILFVILVALGAVAKSSLVWELDDMFNALMALPNLIALFPLSGLLKKITQNYFDRKAGKNVEPMLSAYPEQNEEFKNDPDMED